MPQKGDQPRSERPIMLQDDETRTLDVYSGWDDPSG